MSCCWIMVLNIEPHILHGRTRPIYDTTVSYKVFDLATKIFNYWISILYHKKVGYWGEPFINQPAICPDVCIEMMRGSNGGVWWNGGGSYAWYPCTAGLGVVDKQVGDRLGSTVIPGMYPVSEFTGPPYDTGELLPSPSKEVLHEELVLGWSELLGIATKHFNHDGSKS